MEKIKTLVYGFRDVNKILDILEKDLLDIKCEYITFRKNCIMYDALQWFAPEKSYEYKYSMPYTFYKNFYYKYFPDFVRNWGRFDGVFTKYSDTMQIDYMFKRVVDYCYDVLLKNEIELYLHVDFPHEIVDNIFKNLATELGIKTINSFNIQYLKKRIIMIRDSVEKLGKFKNEQRHISSKGINLNDFLHIKKSIESKPEIFSFNDAINNRALDEQNYFKLSNIKRKTEFENILKKICVNELPKDLKYAYFPLHYQPEAATIALGDAHFEDQSVLIEYILRELPKDYYIVVKEHYLQTYNFRDPAFYQKLAELKKVIFVNPQTDSNEVLKNSQFAITISGSIGFEALLTGKPVVYCGYPMYQEIAGAFEFNENFDINKILNYEFNEEKTRNDLMDYLKTGYEGCSMIYELGLDCSEEENIKKLAYAYTDFISKMFEDSAQYISNLKLKYQDMKKQSLIPDIIDNGLQNEYREYLPDLSYFNNKEYEENFLKPKEKKKTAKEKALIFLEKNTRSLRKLLNK